MATDTAKKSMSQISFKFGMWKLKSYSEPNNICFIKIDQVVFETSIFKISTL